MFWQYQVLQDALTLLALLGWGLTLVLMHFVPGLLGVIGAAYKYKRSEAVSVYIARFVPYILFGQGMHVARALFLVLIALGWGGHVGYISLDVSWQEMLVYIGYAVGGLWFLNVLRSLGYDMWAYIFIPRGVKELLRQDYRVIAILQTLLLAPISLLSLIPEHRELAMFLGLGSVVLSILLRSVQTLRRLLPSSGGYIYVFLYLCTHEWLPWCYIAVALRYAL